MRTTRQAGAPCPTGRRVILAVAVSVAVVAVEARAVPPVPCDTSAGPCWTPPVGARFQYQLEARPRRYAATGGINVDICARPAGGGPCVAPDVYDIDLYIDTRLTGPDTFVPNTPAVEAVHARGRRAICYLSAGTIERFRPDYQQYADFDAACGNCLIGNPYSPPFGDESWLNINNDQGQRDFLLDRIAARLDQCRAAGFDGVEFDNVDAYAQDAGVTGWTIDAATQLDFNRRLANLARARGLTAALKNDLGQADALLPYFDYAINEQCFQYGECDVYAPWIAAGKAVFIVEYRTPPRRFCPAAVAAGYSAIRKSASLSLLDRPWIPCR